MPKSYLIIGSIVIIAVIAGATFFSFKDSLIPNQDLITNPNKFDSGSDDETSNWQVYRNEEIGMEFKYLEKFGEPEKIKNTISFGRSKFSFVEISSFEKLRQQYSEPWSGPGPNPGGMYGNVGLLEKYITTLKQVAEDGTVDFKSEKTIDSYNKFSLMSSVIDNKFIVEPIYLDNLGIYGLKLIGYEGYDVSCCYFYYRIAFIKDEKLITIRFDGLAALPGFDSDKNYDELSNNFSTLKEELKIALNNNSLKDFNPELATEFQEYDKFVKSIMIYDGKLENELIEREIWETYKNEEYNFELMYPALCSGEIDCSEWAIQEDRLDSSYPTIILENTDEKTDSFIKINPKGFPTSWPSISSDYRQRKEEKINGIPVVVETSFTESGDDFLWFIRFLEYPSAWSENNYIIAEVDADLEQKCEGLTEDPSQEELEECVWEKGLIMSGEVNETDVSIINQIISTIKFTESVSTDE